AAVKDSTGSAVAGLLLAAGEGARLGTPKALLEFGGERLVDRGVRLLQEGGCHPVVVVLGAATVQVRGAVTVRNPDWRSGMGSSLRAGLAALPAEPRAVVIALVDQPLVRPEAVRALIGSGAEVAVATYGGRRRNPVLLGRRHFAVAAGPRRPCPPTPDGCPGCRAPAPPPTSAPGTTWPACGRSCRASEPERGDGGPVVAAGRRRHLRLRRHHPAEQDVVGARHREPGRPGEPEPAARHLLRVLQRRRQPAHAPVGRGRVQIAQQQDPLAGVAVDQLAG